MGLSQSSVQHRFVRSVIFRLARQQVANLAVDEIGGAMAWSQSVPLDQARHKCDLDSVETSVSAARIEGSS